MVKKPSGVRILAYNVGFGDCFLLTFHYDDFERHILIDFGSTAAPERAKKSTLLDVAKHIETTTGGRLDAVIVTHRHRDHIGGFPRSRRKNGPGDLIAELAKDAMILMPWTEEPQLAVDALEPVGRVPRGARAMHAAEVRSLTSMHSVADAVAAKAKAMKKQHPHFDLQTRAATSATADGTPLWSGNVGTRLLDRLEFLGEANIKNVPAMESLFAMSSPEKHRYLSYGSKSGLEKVLPGVTTYVLGPPTAQQHAKVRNRPAQRHDEFWHLQALAASKITATEKPIFRRTIPPRQWPKASRWFIRRLRGIHAQQLLQLVTIVDNRLNNTSLILLFECNGEKLLFPGDAQIENWEYALEHADNAPAVRKLLRDVRVYKVGHHGSLNATPKSLWTRFSKKKRGLVTVLSTRRGKHDGEGTEVPRKTLVSALQAASGKNFYTTEKLGTSAKKLAHVIEIDF